MQTTSSNSFKTTIPRNIMKEMGIKQGDYIHWMVVGSGRKKSIQIDTIDIK
ncbi:MAG: AbrB/MazE/SpoVT family DNA-binding domain-containing protein [Alphaproteobacteria bacterium]|nr:AbrB/MazE/SpoVT family DNA-binding domain-containing protein [Alphaproteobacteria bacterium]MDA8029921.1 AbrB/MazE/SpoVT family DNA-binding domain-containing protein [Alphaproteobacteria bacterium]